MKCSHLKSGCLSKLAQTYSGTTPVKIEIETQRIGGIRYRENLGANQPPKQNVRFVFVGFLVIFRALVL